ncbi:hypothetical protein EDB85DRAFT_2151958 [Lactarius pseudohatsudake]|nr:hypothetical protein EDB85DRAFT_2151958 [Lactarius pseudohatsudake]
MAIRVGSGIHVFCYDNVQISTSIFIEQCGSSGPAKVTSGTFGVLYPVHNGNPEHMQLAPILERFRNMKGLEYRNDICPSPLQLKSFYFQLKVINQLRQTTEDLCKYAIPTFNDQLTNSQICSGQILWARDKNPWTWREVFQLSFGLFHLCLNLVWALLHIHRGSLDQTGSLTFFFALLEKTHLGGDHPDYHTLLHESGYCDLGEYAATEPSVEDLLRMAGVILMKHATPMATPTTALDDEIPYGDYESSALDSETDFAGALPNTMSEATMSLPDPSRDKAHQNLWLLTHNLLYMAELVCAISDGNIGHIEDMLPTLAMMFCGAGGNNYCTEILHFILNLKHVWTPEFVDIMRDNMLVNVLGLVGHAMPIDLNIEHLIGKLKVLLQAKGLQSTWDCLGNISASVDVLKKLKKQVALAMNTAYQGTTHKDPRTDHLVWRVAKKIHEERLHLYMED